jgi:hypothetical protein
MAGIPQNFQSISPVIANYDFVDIASGTGYINFYAGKTVDLNLLSNFTYYSDNNKIATAGTEVFEINVYTLSLDVDFDTVLNRPLDIRGKGILSLPIRLSAYGSVGTTQYTYATVKLRKWDGVTETEICENDSSVLSAAGTGSITTNYAMLSIDLNVPITHFKQGENLRLTILLYAKTSDVTVSGSTPSIGHDPMNRTTGWDTTGVVPSLMRFQCPVRLNL